MKAQKTHSRGAAGSPGENIDENQGPEPQYPKDSEAGRVRAVISNTGESDSGTRNMGKRKEIEQWWK